MISGNKAIASVGILTAVVLSAAYMLTNRYQVAEPFDPNLFNRFDRWTSRVEACSSMYDGRTYCGEELDRRLEQAITAEHEAADRKLNAYGYTQLQIAGWPRSVADGARNIVRNNGTKDEIEEWLRRKAPSAKQ